MLKKSKINWTLNFQTPEIESDTLKNIVWSEHKNRLIILDVGRSHDPNGDMLVLAPYLMIYSIFLHPDGICILWSKRCTKCPWKNFMKNQASHSYRYIIPHLHKLPSTIFNKYSNQDRNRIRGLHIPITTLVSKIGF